MLTIQFSEPIDKATVSAATVAITSGGVVIGGTYVTSGSSVSFTPTALLQQGTTYDITVTVGVKDVAGNPLKAAYTKAIKIPITAPSMLNVTAEPLQSTLSWQPVSGATSYNVYWLTTYGVAPSNGTKISGATSPYTHTGLANGTTYYYVVTAVVGTSESAPSNQASVLIDNVPPTVLSSTPANSTTSVSISSLVCVTFSKSINSNTWNSLNVSFKDSAGAVVSGSYQQYSNCFYPSPALGFNTTYTMTVGAGVKDYSGNSLATPYNFSFTTVAVGTPAGLVATRSNLDAKLTWSPAGGATSYNIYWSRTPGVTKLNGTKISGVTTTSYSHVALTSGLTYYYVVTAVNSTAEGIESSQASVLIDNVAPTVTSTTPTNSATNVGISTQLTVYFSKNIDMNSWTTANVVMKDSGGAIVSGQLTPTYYSPQTSASLTPATSLAFHSTYTVTISNIKDTAGNSIATPYSFSFTTGLAAPTGLGATTGALQTSLSWPAVANATSYNVYWGNNTGITQANSIKISGITTPAYLHTNLANGSIYYYRMTAVVGGMESPLSNEVNVSYDTTAPTVSSTNPTNGNISAYPGSSCSVYFNEAIDPASVKSSTITVTSGGVTVAGNANGSTSSVYWYTADPRSLIYGTTYSATISGVTDLAGNLMAPYTWTWTNPALGTPSATASAGTSGSKQITISWSLISGATNYNVYYSTTTGVTKANGTQIVGATPPFTHTGLSAGITYYYVVTAVSGSTESAASNQVSAVAP